VAREVVGVSISVRALQWAFERAAESCYGEYPNSIAVRQFLLLVERDAGVVIYDGADLAKPGKPDCLPNPPQLE